MCCVHYLPFAHYYTFNEISSAFIEIKSETNLCQCVCASYKIHGFNFFSAIT